MVNINEIVWVAVPDGLVPGASPAEARIRVLMVPRLSGSHIDTYDPLTDWPATLTELADGSIAVLSRKGDGGTQSSVGPTSVSVANSTAWRGFFGGAAGEINPFEVKPMRSPTVRPTYTEATKAHLMYRNLTRNVVQPGADQAKLIRDGIISEWATDPEEAVPPTSQARPQFSTPDFHAAVSMLREHPTVLRDLGLIFDITVPAANLQRGAEDLQVAVISRDPLLRAPFLVSPWTRYHLNPVQGLFRPAPAPGSDAGISQGMLDLTDTQNVIALTDNIAQSRWAIATFDVDGAVGGLRRAARDFAENPEVAPAMPPVRSAGLMLLRTDRQADFDARASTGNANGERALTDAVLSADDLILGYRLDIKHGDDSWHSVCERETRYAITVDGEKVPVGTADLEEFLQEEGHVKPFAAVRDARGNLRADDVVIRWDGWNLALPKPNLAENTDGPAPTDTDRLPYDFEFKHRLRRGPGRLPSLRFSHDYQMRIRIADLAGGGVPFQDGDGSEKFASERLTYRRHEPVGPPRVSEVEEFAVGAALDRLVIRSDKGVTTAELHAAEGYPDQDIRRLDPPITTLQLIEAHGVFDDMPLEESFKLAQQAMAAQVSGSGLPDSIVSAVNPTVRDKSGVESTLSIVDKWFDDEVHPWPKYDAKRIELREAHTGTAQLAISWVDDPMQGLPTRTLVVALGKGKQAEIHLTSTLLQGMVDHLAAGEFFPNNSQSETATRAGRNHVVTPPRRLLAVHAVKLPLANPLWELPVAALVRNKSDRIAVLTPQLAVITDVDANPDATGLHVDSTGRLTVSAAWNEFHDSGAQASAGGEQVTVANVHSESVPEKAPSPGPGGLIRYGMKIVQDFGDTKHRRVTYSLKATGRYREYFHKDSPESDFQVTREQPPVTILSSTRPPDPVVLGIVPAFRWARTTPGPDRIEHVRTAQRLRVELARPWYVTGEGEKLAVVLAASGNPAAASDLITRVGRDPLFATPGIGPLPQANWFTVAPAPGAVRVPELGNATVTVIPFTVTPDGDRWFADVDIVVPAVQRSYNPFVELAVARFQAGSLPGLEMSRIVLCDKVPLLPDRKVVVTRAGSQVTVTVEGVSPNPPNRLDVILETCPAGIPPETVDLTVDDPATEPGIPAWRPVPGQAVARGANGVIPPLTLPSVPGRLRLRLRETETFQSQPPGALDLSSRNVFVDTIILPEGWRP